MGFGDKLRLIRKERGITQEELADMLEVSRQAVSKWEAGNGYPETEKLLLVAKKLEVSLDYLMDYEVENHTEKNETVIANYKTNHIIIKKFDGSQTVNCISVKYSKILAPAKNEPTYILQGVDSVGMFGPHTVNLGWYDDEAAVKKEMEEILQAIERGEVMYQLKYYTDVEFKGIFGVVKRKVK